MEAVWGIALDTRNGKYSKARVPTGKTPSSKSQASVVGVTEGNYFPHLKLQA